MGLGGVPRASQVARVRFKNVDRLKYFVYVVHRETRWEELNLLPESLFYYVPELSQPFEVEAGVIFMKNTHTWLNRTGNGAFLTTNQVVERSKSYTNIEMNILVRFPVHMDIIVIGSCSTSSPATTNGK